MVLQKIFFECIYKRHLDHILNPTTMIPVKRDKTYFKYLLRVSQCEMVNIFRTIFQMFIECFSVRYLKKTEKYHEQYNKVISNTSMIIIKRNSLDFLIII
jgi:hypothetical protein